MKIAATILLLGFLHTNVMGQVFSDFTADEIKSDINFLYQHLSVIHPNSIEMDSSKIEVIKSSLVTEHYSESDAFFIFNGMLKLLNDGHSNVKFSEDRIRNIIKYGEFFPYELQFFDSTAVVIGTIGNNYEETNRREIFKINNIPIKSILEDLAVVAMVDGENNSSATEWLSDDFWFYFTIYNGFRSSYSITYIEKGKEFHEIAKAMNRNDFLKTSFLDDFRSQPFELSKTDGMQVLTIANFDQKSSYWWKRNLKSIFKELENDQSNHLVLDLRDNGGGQENLQNILLESLGVSTSEKYDLEILKKFDFKAVKGLQKKGREKLKSFGLENLVYRENYGKDYRAKKKCACRNNESLFSGELYILIDGTTFSCASDAAAILKQNYSKTTLIGTETRGSGKVNYAGYFVHVELPNTGLVIRVPRVKYVLKNDSFSAVSGIIPDIHIAMEKTDVQKNIDSQLSFIYSYLKKQSALQD